MQKAKFFIGAPGAGKTSQIVKMANAVPLKTLVLARGKNHSGQREYMDLIGDQIEYVDIGDEDFVVSLNQTLIEGKFDRIIVDEMQFLEDAEKRLGSQKAQKLFRTWRNVTAEMLIATTPDHFIEMLVESGNLSMSMVLSGLKDHLNSGIMFDTESESQYLFSEL